MKKRELFYLWIASIMALSAACAPAPPADEPTPVVSSTTQDSSHSDTPSPPPGETLENSTPTSLPGATEIIPAAGHLMKPADTIPAPAKMVEDVESSGTGPEGRAPYGDSYKLNRFERPFQQDMTYVPDMDIHEFGLSEDADWYFITIQLIGNDPNNALGIHYGAEIDLNADGFGDYLIWATPPYTDQWDTRTVQVFQDSNLDSAGVSAIQSDAVFDGDGYDTLVFDGAASPNSDPDLAWVRMNADEGTVQIAFKKSLTGTTFLVGAVSDSGLKDVSKYDYADHFPATEAGSPVRNNAYYPLGLVYGVDNTCWQAYGIETTGYEPKLCQPILQPVHTQPASGEEPLPACDPPPGCEGYDPVTCECPL